MKEEDVKEQEKKISKYRELETIRSDARAALSIVADPQEGKNPFTGNTRESRQVISMTLHFTATRGTSPTVNTTIPELYIEAYELGVFLKEQLKKRLDKINAEMEAL